MKFVSPSWSNCFSFVDTRGDRNQRSYGQPDLFSSRVHWFHFNHLNHLAHITDTLICKRSAKMLITIEDASGKSFTVDVESSDTIKSVKAKIHTEVLIKCVQYLAGNSSTVSERNRAKPANFDFWRPIVGGWQNHRELWNRLRWYHLFEQLLEWRRHCGHFRSLHVREDYHNRSFSINQDWRLERQDQFQSRHSCWTPAFDLWR